MKTFSKSRSYIIGGEFDERKLKKIKTIGEGGFGVVEKHRYDGRIDVAVKIIEKSTLKNAFGEEYKERYFRELDLMKLLGKKTKHVVQLIDYIQTDEQFILIMELCDKSLSAYLEEKRDIDRYILIKKMLTQLNEAFKEMQKEKVIHRDIKEENILIKIKDGKEIFKLSDFGCGKEIKTDVARTLVGTVAYAAPEIVLHKEQNNLVDMFELGSTIYHILFDKFPYDSIEKLNIYTKHFYDDYSITLDMLKDSKLADLLARMLKVNPKKRLTWDEYFKHPYFTTSIYDYFDKPFDRLSDKKDSKFDSFDKPSLISKKRERESERNDSKKDHFVRTSRVSFGSTKKEIDLIYMVDATGSMSSSIEKVKNYCKVISQKFKEKLPSYDIKYGGIFYRDPVDCPGDFHSFIDLTSDLDEFKDEVSRIEATGGGDSCEDWVGAYKMAMDDISWRNGEKNMKIIFHIADAGAHGDIFSGYRDSHNEEGPKLEELLRKVSRNKVSVVGLYITEGGCKSSFEKCEKIFRTTGAKINYILKKFNPEDSNPNHFINLIVEPTIKLSAIYFHDK